MMITALPAHGYNKQKSGNLTVNSNIHAPEFGVTLPDATEIRVWDSTAETRYMVLPMRPAGTDGWSAEQLADIVTRDSMIGTGLVEAAS